MKNSLISHVNPLILLIMVQTFAWDGTADITWYTADTSLNTYTITTAEQLAGLAGLVNGTAGYASSYVSFQNKTIILGDSIVLNKRQWDPIGNRSDAPFRGDFDGNNKIITGLYIDKATENYKGLFGYFQGIKISNVHLDTAYVKGQNYVGCIVGYGSNSQKRTEIFNSYCIGKVEGALSVGGIVGEYRNDDVYNDYNIINGCHFNGTVMGTGSASYIGGIVGHGRTVINSYFDGKEVQGRDCVGGIMGDNVNALGKVINSYVVGNVSGTQETGGLMGSTRAENKVINSWFAGTSSNGEMVEKGSLENSFHISQSDTLEKICKSLNNFAIAQNKTEEVNIAYAESEERYYVSNHNDYYGWECNGSDYPTLSGSKAEGNINLTEYFAGGTGTFEEPYIVDSLEHLKNLANLVELGHLFNNEYIKLMANIDLEKEEWKPIGVYNNQGSIYVNGAFMGNFDGNGYVISGLFINSNDDGDKGLFGYTHNANISNLGLVDFNISGGDGFIGSIIGVNYDGSVTNSYAIEGSVSGTNDWIVSAIGNCSGRFGLVNCSDNISNTYFAGELLGNNTNFINGVEISASDMKDSLAYIAAGFDFGSIWEMGTNGYPVHLQPLLKKQNISTATVYLKNQRLKQDSIPTTLETYTSKPITPVVDSVYFNGNKLNEGTDYEVLYYNNVNIGNNAKIMVQGKGDYSGARVLDFYIVEPIPRNILDSSKVTIGQLSDTIADGSFFMPNPVIKDISFGFFNSVTLLAGKDYTLKYDSNQFEGAATVTIEGIGIYEGETTRTFNISGRVYVDIIWDTSCDTTFVYNGKLQHPKIDTATKFKEYLTPLMGVQKNAGLGYKAAVSTTSAGQKISLRNNSCSYSIIPQELPVTWTGPTEYVYNKMVQSPKPSINKGLLYDNLNFVFDNANHLAGEYKGMDAAIYTINPADSNANNYRLLNNRADYTITKKSLNPYFSATMQNFETNKSDTLWVPHEVFQDSVILHSILSSIIDYEGFATDTTKAKPETDDANVLKGTPTITLNYAQPLATSHSPLAKRVETTQKATATIITDNVSANNYALTRSAIVIMATIEENDGAEKIFCRLGTNCALFSEQVCSTIGGEEVETCTIEIACVIENLTDNTITCVPNTLASECKAIGGRAFNTCAEATPIPTTPHSPLATSHLPKY
ncbi:MAG: hypothetical protein FWC26_12270, partial [Fibromonadales bacterium]|nr:hypothetical protein [Fibromonadales bacterium]